MKKPRIVGVLLLVVLLVVGLLAFAGPVLADDGSAPAATGTALLANDTLASEAAVLFMLIAANFVLTVGYALYVGRFEWAKFGDWLIHHVLSLAVPWVFIAGMGWAAAKYGGISGWQETGIGTVATIAYASVMGILVKKALSTFKDLGVTIPDATTNAGKS